MPRLGFIGDLHGDVPAARNVIDHLVSEGCTELVQVGDWGFIWPNNDVFKQLSNHLRLRGIRMRFIDGNHDQHPILFRLPADSKRINQDPETDNVAPYLIYQHRGSLHEYPDGTRVVFFGGAPSIDYRGRVEHVSWWHEELITDQDAEAALKWHGTKVDILVTHDAPVVPGHLKTSNDMTFVYRAEQSVEKIARVATVLEPRLLIHGHYHYRYSTKYKATQVEGLDCNLGRFPCLYYIDG